MSDLRVSTISDLAGTGPVTLTKQVAAKAWVSYTQSTPVINDSFNVSSVSDDGTGLFTANFTNAMAAGNYSVQGLISGNAYGSYAVASTTSANRRTWLSGGTTLTDLTSATSVIGDLA